MSLFAVASVANKGGTGKTLSAINVALELAKKYKVALFDADISAANLPAMMGIRTKMALDEQRRFVPVVWEKNGISVKVVSISLFDNEGPVLIYKPGLECAQIVNDMLKYTDWGDTEILVVDLPAGTGDETSAVIQTLGDQLAGVFMVMLPTTYDDCIRVMDFCAREHIHIMGMIENQSGARSFDGKRVVIEGENREFYPLGVPGLMINGEHVPSMKEGAEKSGIGYLGGVPLVEGLFRQIVLMGDPRIPVHSNEAIRNAAAKIEAEYEKKKGGM